MTAVADVAREWWIARLADKAKELVLQGDTAGARCYFYQLRDAINGRSVEQIARLEREKGLRKKCGTQSEAL